MHCSFLTASYHKQFVTDIKLQSINTKQDSKSCNLIQLIFNLELHIKLTVQSPDIKMSLDAGVLF